MRFEYGKSRSKCENITFNDQPWHAAIYCSLSDVIRRKNYFFFWINIFEHASELNFIRLQSRIRIQSIYSYCASIEMRFFNANCFILITIDFETLIILLLQLLFRLIFSTPCWFVEMLRCLKSYMCCSRKVFFP